MRYLNIYLKFSQCVFLTLCMYTTIYFFILYKQKVLESSAIFKCKGDGLKTFENAILGNSDNGDMYWGIWVV